MSRLKTGGGISQGQGDARYLRKDAPQGNTPAEMQQALENAGLTLKANGDAFSLDAGIQANTEVPLQDATP